MIGEDITIPIPFWIKRKNLDPKQTHTFSQKIRIRQGGYHIDVNFVKDILRNCWIKRVEKTNPAEDGLLKSDIREKEMLRRMNYWDSPLQEMIWRWVPGYSKEIYFITAVGEETISAPFEVTLLESKYIKSGENETD